MSIRLLNFHEPLYPFRLESPYSFSKKNVSIFDMKRVAAGISSEFLI